MLTDIRFVARSLLKNPGFTTIVVLTLALGIGATTAIFSVVSNVLLKPLPFAQAEQLARIYTEFPALKNNPSGFDSTRAGVNIPEYLDLKRETTAWSAIEGWSDFGGVNIATGSESSRAAASFVTGGLMNVLGVKPALGRSITPQDGEPGAPNVAVISDGLWTRLFARQESILGREILLNGKKHMVVGVMPAGFQSPSGFGATEASELWIPMQINPANPGDRGSHFFNLLGRLKTGVTLQQAQAELNVLVERWGKNSTVSDRDRFDSKEHPVTIRNLTDETVRSVRPALRVLLGAVCCLLLIACVNVANLLLVRAEARQQEISIRGALGAGLGQLARQFVIEGIALAFIGAIVGLLVAKAGLAIIKLAAVSNIPRAAEIGIDPQVLLFAAALSVVTGILFGMVPLVHVFRRDLQSVLKSAAASTMGSVKSHRFHHSLVVSQLALALVLLIGTGLMLRAFSKLQQVDPGFDPRSTLSMVIGVSGSESPTQDLLARIEGRLNAVPGVHAAALATGLHPTGSLMTGVGMGIEGVAPTPQTTLRSTPQYPGFYIVDYCRIVSSRYPETLGIRMVEGRFFDERDDPQAPKVAVINQAMARTFWGDESPVGRRIRAMGSERTVVGVIADAKNEGLGKPAGTEVYLPFTQNAFFFDRFFDRLGSVNVAIRSDLAPSALMSAVRRELKQIDPRLPIVKVRTMDELISLTQSRPRFLTLLLTAFATIAVLLAAVGIYSVISYAVAQRTKEFGLRMALGALPKAVLGSVLKRGALLAMGGVAIGLAGAFALTRYLSEFLFGIEATDPATFVSVSLLMCVIALMASYIPARRATKVDPLVALRAG